MKLPTHSAPMTDQALNRLVNDIRYMMADEEGTDRARAQAARLNKHRRRKSDFQHGKPNLELIQGGLES